MSLRIYTCVVFVIASIIFLPLSSIVDASDQVFIDTAQIQIVAGQTETGAQGIEGLQYF